MSSEGNDEDYLAEKDDPAREADLMRKVIGLAESLFGLAESWESRPANDPISERSRRMLATDLADLVKLMPSDNVIPEFVSEVSALRDPLFFGDGAEQVRWITRRLCAAYNIDSRRLKPRKIDIPASISRNDQAITSTLPTQRHLSEG